MNISNGIHDQHNRLQLSTLGLESYTAFFYTHIRSSRQCNGRFKELISLNNQCHGAVVGS